MKDIEREIHDLQVDLENLCGVPKEKCYKIAQSLILCGWGWVGGNKED